jgi:hypothetical protein
VFQTCCKCFSCFWHDTCCNGTHLPQLLGAPPWVTVRAPETSRHPQRVIHGQGQVIGIHKFLHVQWSGEIVAWSPRGGHVKTGCASFFLVRHGLPRKGPEASHILDGFGHPGTVTPFTVRSVTLLGTIWPGQSRMLGEFGCLVLCPEWLGACASKIWLACRGEAT